MAACAPARPGTKTQGFGGRPLRTITTNAEEFPAQGILCQRNRTFPSRCSWNAVIYWVGFTFRNPPGTQPTVKSEVYLSCGSNQLAAMQLSVQLSHTATLTRRQAVSAATPGYTGQAGVAGSGAGREHSRTSKQQVGPGSLTAGVQVLPAEAGTHCVPDRTAGARGAQAASPQLRLQIPALGGHVITCSYAFQQAWEPVPRSNGGGPLCSFVRDALAKVSEGPVGPWKSSTDNDEDIRSLPNPSDPVPLPEGQGECDRHAIPSAALEGHSPYTGEREPVFRIDEKLVGEYPGPEAASHQREGGFRAWFSLLPTLLWMEQKERDRDR
ncbi:hypothetical protein U0070_019544 [Myodes glareolus]|uniref:Uncharacterized protein n=1 Tax=Myodes glareolus TaxID=447135 RepID=A0AAW0JLN8_MYOGA